MTRGERQTVRVEQLLTVEGDDDDGLLGRRVGVERGALLAQQYDDDDDLAAQQHNHDWGYALGRPLISPQDGIELDYEHFKW